MENLSNHGTYGKAANFVMYLSGFGQGSNYGSVQCFSNYFTSSNYINNVRIGVQIQASADCIRFNTSAGTIAAGQFTLYGVTQ